MDTIKLFSVDLAENSIKVYVINAGSKEIDNLVFKPDKSIHHEKS